MIDPGSLTELLVGLGANPDEIGARYAAGVFCVNGQWYGILKDGSREPVTLTEGGSVVPAGSQK